MHEIAIRGLSIGLQSQKERAFARPLRPQRYECDPVIAMYACLACGPNWTVIWAAIHPVHAMSSKKGLFSWLELPHARQLLLFSAYQQNKQGRRGCLCWPEETTPEPLLVEVFSTRSVICVSRRKVKRRNETRNCSA